MGSEVKAEKYPVRKLEKDPKHLHMYVRNIRVFTVDEYLRLREAIPKDRHRVILDMLLITGMRYVELRRLYLKREWYNQQRNIIHLPEQAQRKAKRKQPERTIRPLPGAFSYIVKDFVNDKIPPTEAVWNQLLQRHASKAGLNPFGISAKSTRKTIESWMVAAGILESAVCLRQGHDSLTSMRHYQGLAFSDNEIADIKKQLTVWGILK